jgi:glycosyltransferase involved in cell wall biosynthesis
MKVSILIPFFNAEKYLGKTIESALSQTYDEKEIILVNDGSTDDSLAIAQSYIPNGVKIFSQPNGGACRARNKAFQEASGDYVQFLDCDDLLSSDKIKNQLAMITGTDKDVVLSCRFIRFTNDDQVPLSFQKVGYLDRDWKHPIDWLISEWNGMGMGQTSIWLTPRHLIEQAGPWNERLAVNQDGEFFTRVLLKARAIRYCEDGFVFYRSGNSESISQKFSMRKATDLLLSYKLYEENALTIQNSARVRAALANKYASFIYSHYDNFPELACEAREHILSLGFSKLPIMGGRNFKFLARISGFENALKLRSLIRKGLTGKRKLHGLTTATKQE